MRALRVLVISPVRRRSIARTRMGLHPENVERSLGSVNAIFEHEAKLRRDGGIAV
jgi:hypothetical protein